MPHTSIHKALFNTIQKQYREIFDLLNGQLWDVHMNTTMEIQQRLYTIIYLINSF